MPESFLIQLFFLTMIEAQRLISRYYPGWYIKMSANGTARIYNPKRQLKHIIAQGEKNRRY